MKKKRTPMRDIIKSDDGVLSESSKILGHVS